MTGEALSFDAYVRLPATNWSSLKRLRESPLKYQHALHAQDEDTIYRAKGRAAHALIFEPATFERDFAIFDGERRAGKAWDAFQAEHAGKTLLKACELEDVAAMANAVRVHPLVAPYLTDGEFERSIAWTDPDSGEPCKARIDWWSHSKRALIDLKTTTTIDAFRFGRIAARLGYQCQLAHYYNGVRYGLRRMVEEVAIVAVESSAPYDVAVFVVDDEALYAGQEEVSALIRRLQECREAGVWPGRYAEKQALQLPQWIFGDEDEEEGLGITVGGVSA